MSAARLERAVIGGRAASAASPWVHVREEEERRRSTAEPVRRGSPPGPASSPTGGGVSGRRRAGPSPVLKAAGEKKDAPLSLDAEGDELHDLEGEALDTRSPRGDDPSWFLLEQMPGRYPNRKARIEERSRLVHVSQAQCDQSRLPMKFAGVCSSAESETSW
jgi:hypothetical protein